MHVLASTHSVGRVDSVLVRSLVRPTRIPFLLNCDVYGWEYWIV